MMVLWIKVVHIVAVVAWMAGLFYLPRLFVYHCEQRSGSETDDLFQIMERRLLYAIMRPAAVVALISGTALVSASGFSFTELWLLLKLAMVACLVGYHGFLEICRIRFSSGRNARSARFYRIVNEVPTVLLIAIVIFVVVKPLP